MTQTHYFNLSLTFPELALCGGHNPATIQQILSKTGLTIPFITKMANHAKVHPDHMLLHSDHIFAHKILLPYILSFHSPTFAFMLTNISINKLRNPATSPSYESVLLFMKPQTNKDWRELKIATISEKTVHTTLATLHKLLYSELLTSTSLTFAATAIQKKFIHFLASNISDDKILQLEGSTFVVGLAMPLQTVVSQLHSIEQSHL